MNGVLASSPEPIAHVRAHSLSPQSGRPLNGFSARPGFDQQAYARAKQRAALQNFGENLPPEQLAKAYLWAEMSNQQRRMPQPYNVSGAQQLRDNAALVNSAEILYEGKNLLQIVKEASIEELESIYKDATVGLVAPSLVRISSPGPSKFALKLRGTGARLAGAAAGLEVLAAKVAIGVIYGTFKETHRGQAHGHLMQQLRHKHGVSEAALSLQASFLETDPLSRLYEGVELYPHEQQAFAEAIEMFTGHHLDLENPRDPTLLALGKDGVRLFELGLTNLALGQTVAELVRSNKKSDEVTRAILERHLIPHAIELLGVDKVAELKKDSDKFLSAYAAAAEKDLMKTAREVLGDETFDALKSNRKSLLDRVVQEMAKQGISKIRYEQFAEDTTKPLRQLYSSLQSLPLSHAERRWVYGAALLNEVRNLAKRIELKTGSAKELYTELSQVLGLVKSFFAYQGPSFTQLVREEVNGIDRTLTELESTLAREHANLRKLIEDTTISAQGRAFLGETREDYLALVTIAYINRLSHAVGESVRVGAEEQSKDFKKFTEESSEKDRYKTHAQARETESFESKYEQLLEALIETAPERPPTLPGLSTSGTLKNLGEFSSRCHLANVEAFSDLTEEQRAMLRVNKYALSQAAQDCLGFAEGFKEKPEKLRDMEREQGVWSGLMAHLQALESFEQRLVKVSSGRYDPAVVTDLLSRYEAAQRRFKQVLGDEINEGLRVCQSYHSSALPPSVQPMPEIGLTGYAVKLGKEITPLTALPKQLLYRNLPGDYEKLYNQIPAVYRQLEQAGKGTVSFRYVAMGFASTGHRDNIDADVLSPDGFVYRSHRGKPYLVVEAVFTLNGSVPQELQELPQTFGSAPEYQIWRRGLLGKDEKVFAVEKLNRHRVGEFRDPEDLRKKKYLYHGLAGSAGLTKVGEEIDRNQLIPGDVPLAEPVNVEIERQWDKNLKQAFLAGETHQGVAYAPGLTQDTVAVDTPFDASERRVYLTEVDRDLREAERVLQGLTDRCLVKSLQEVSSGLVEKHNISLFDDSELAVRARELDRAADLVYSAIHFTAEAQPELAAVLEQRVGRLDSSSTLFQTAIEDPSAFATAGSAHSVRQELELKYLREILAPQAFTEELQREQITAFLNSRPDLSTMSIQQMTDAFLAEGQQGKYLPRSADAVMRRDLLEQLRRKAQEFGLNVSEQEAVATSMTPLPIAVPPSPLLPAQIKGCHARGRYEILSVASAEDLAYEALRKDPHAGASLALALRLGISRHSLSEPCFDAKTQRVVVSGSNRGRYFEVAVANVPVRFLGDEGGQAVLLVESAFGQPIDELPKPLASDLKQKLGALLPETQRSLFEQGLITAQVTLDSARIDSATKSTWSGLQGKVRFVGEGRAAGETEIALSLGQTGRASGKDVGVEETAPSIDFLLMRFNEKYLVRAELAAQKLRDRATVIYGWAQYGHDIEKRFKLIAADMNTTVDPRAPDHVRPVTELKSRADGLLRDVEAQLAHLKMADERRPDPVRLRETLMKLETELPQRMDQLELAGRENIEILNAFLAPVDKAHLRSLAKR